MSRAAKKTALSNAENEFANVSFERDGIIEYENKYRQFLSSKRLKNDELIEHAVWLKTEVAWLKFQVTGLKEQLSSIAKDSERVVKQVSAGESNKEILRQRQYLKDGELGPPNFRMTRIGPAPGDRSILDAIVATIENTPSKRANVINARKQRDNTPHYREVEKFQVDYVCKHGYEHGWKKVASEHFKVSTRTISRLAKK